jgi:hypothetical protein
MRHLPILLLLSTPLFFNGCAEKEEPFPGFEQLKKCLTASARENPKVQGKVFASFEMNGIKVLFNDGENDYAQFSAVAETYVTSGPVLGPNNETKMYMLQIGLRQNKITPNDMLPASADMIFLSLHSKSDGSLTSLIDNNIQVGDLSMRKRGWWDGQGTTEDKEGFAINYWCYDCCNSDSEGRSFHWYDSTSPYQPGFIRCTKFVKADQDDYYVYSMAFEFEVELYSGRYESWAAIKDGKMELELLVKK